MTATVIWSLALLFYTTFWCWYVGFRKKITAAEVAETMRLFDGRSSLTEQQVEHVRHFLANDDGKDFVMVNLLHLAKPVGESRKKLGAYQKIFLGALLRKAGHPVMIATAASGNIENVACDHADDWSAAGMVRYRSRRDFMEMLPPTIGSEHHGLKLAALEKTFAFPASPWFMFGGPRVVVALVIALIAALLQLTAG
ncbi:MAG: hypothetical protein ACR2P1_25400 [Pseudomonadales bacterium]